MEQVFSDIYRRNGWGGESRSGKGSGLEQTQVLRSRLPELIRSYGIESMLDIPCGDFFWINEVVDNSGLQDYVGADIVAELIHANQDRYPYLFNVLDITYDELPEVDLIFCRDCLVHLPEREVWNAIYNVVRSGATYFMATTFPWRANRDGPLGGWRPVNLMAPPYSFPKPLEIVNEKNEEFPDKSMGLWCMSDIEQKMSVR